MGYPECFFDDIILNLLSDQFKDGFVIMEEFTSLTKEKYGYVNYFMFKSIIDRLCKKGLVEPSEKYDVFFVPNLIKFKKAKQVKTKYLDALNELSFALEDGSTYGLYRLLSEDAEFYSCSTEKRLNGRDEIIDYIEQKALLRWEKEEVSPCRCYKYEDEEINYYEDVKLYLYYPKDNYLDEIEWVFKDGKFNKILIKPCPVDIKFLKQYNPFKLKLKKKN